MQLLSRFATGVVAYNLFVILFGAWVRITGSGAGCGDHWPTCNGDIVPRAPKLATIIEFSHRLSSGLSLILIAALLIWTFRATQKGHRARTNAVLLALFIILEALIGAGLVLFHLVDKDASVARAVVVAIHLVNTLGLLACGTLTAYFTAAPRERAATPSEQAWLTVSLVTVAAICASGAITALGDTLFPVHGAITPEPTHFLVRLRIVHPALAACAAVLLAITARKSRLASESAARAAKYLVALTHAQLLIGTLNIVLRAPGYMQLIHLLMANLVWICLVFLTATRRFATPSRR